MARFLLRKLGFSVLVLWGVASLVFLLFMVLPSADQMLIGQRSDVQTRDAIVKELGLDQPLPLRYMRFMNDLSPVSLYRESDRAAVARGLVLLPLGNRCLIMKMPWLGYSYQTRQPVSAMLAEAFPGTLVLASAALLFAAICGIALGIVAALRSGTWLDKGINTFSVLGISAPSFFSAILVAWLFGYVWKEWTGLSMTGSLYEVDPLGRGVFLAPQHLVLPAFALGLRPLSVFVQLTRDSVQEQLKQGYVRTAVAKGLSRSRILFRHVLRNALNPVITAVTGWFASLLAGAFFTEYIFNWKGIGKLTIDALQQSDLPVVMGAVLLSAMLFVVISILTDLLYFILDPRVRPD